MAQTVQRVSSVLAEKTKKQYNPSSSSSASSTEPEAEDTESLLFSMCERLDNLYAKLLKLNHVMEKK